MKYTVVWKPAAENELAAIWNIASDRAAATAAADAIEKSLRTDPVLRRETSTRTTRVIIEAPLIVKYRIFDDDRLVRILTVQRLPSNALPT
ncbi:MAG: type II toxin-antitoxin system RelE/ParE family toxin [Deltaproteobacteria bacterium]